VKTITVYGGFNMNHTEVLDLSTPPTAEIPVVKSEPDFAALINQHNRQVERINHGWLHPPTPARSASSGKPYIHVVQPHDPDNTKSADPLAEILWAAVIFGIIAVLGFLVWNSDFGREYRQEFSKPQVVINYDAPIEAAAPRAEAPAVQRSQHLSSGGGGASRQHNAPKAASTESASVTRVEDVLKREQTDQAKLNAAAIPVVLADEPEPTQEPTAEPTVEPTPQDVVVKPTTPAGPTPKKKPDTEPLPPTIPPLP
jgi:cytoskeletal protein RodZ